MKIARIIVISPPVLGERRLKKFMDRIGKLPFEIPPVEVAEGVNKNWLDLTPNKDIANSVIDNRHILAKMKIRMKREPNCISINSKELTGIFKAGGGRSFIGNIGNSVGQVRAWKRIVELDAPCLVLEDDHALRDSAAPMLDFTPPVDKPDYLITFYPSRVAGKVEHSEDYFMMDNASEGTWSSGALIIPPTAAKTLLEMLPQPVGMPVDYFMFYQSPFPVFATKTDIALETGRSINTNTKLTWDKVLNPKKFVRRLVNFFS